MERIFNYMQEGTFLINTNQFWKLWLIGFLSVIEMVLLILMISSITNPEYFILANYKIGELELRTAFLLLGVLLLYSMFYLIECPHCHKKPVYKIISESNFNDWMLAVVNFKHCPYCNYPGDNGDSHKNISFP